MSLDVVRAIEISEFVHCHTTISKSRIEEWKQSDDENVLGLLLYAVSHGWERIQPGLSRAEYGDLILNVFRVAVEGKAESKTRYAPSPYEAGYSLATWASEAIGSIDTEPQIFDVLTRVEEVLAGLYRTGDESQRRCIVDGLLEHLFESLEIRPLFASWRSQSDLLPAFEQAEKWGDHVARKRSLLHRVAESAAQQISSQIANIRGIRKPEVGTDTAVLEFANPSEARGELVIDCDDELIGFVENLETNATPKFIESLANYAADPSHWGPGEHLASQLWVKIPKTLSEAGFAR